MKLEIITPESIIFNGDVTLVKVPGTKGSFEILNNHAPIISTLEEGRIKIITANKETKFFDIDGGVVEVNSNKIIVLAESI